MGWLAARDSWHATGRGTPSIIPKIEVILSHEDMALKISLS
jgi:hypothetical protein